MESKNAGLCDHFPLATFSPSSQFSFSSKATAIIQPGLAYWAKRAIVVSMEIVSQIPTCILVLVPRGSAGGMRKEKETKQGTHLKIQLKLGKAPYCSLIPIVMPYG